MTISEESFIKNAFNKRSNAIRSLALGLSAIVAVPGLALAGPANSDAAVAASYQSNYKLSYNPGELNSSESVKALHRRIRRVALDYCPDYAVTRNMSAHRSCVNDVESDLVLQVDNPLLTRIHSGETARSIAGISR